MPTPKRFAAALALFFLAAGAPATVEAACRGESFEGADYTVCSFDLTKADLRMFWLDGEGTPYRTFSALASALEAQGAQLAFGMNGGMYDDSFAPIGLYVEDGRELAAANTNTVTDCLL